MEQAQRFALNALKEYPRTGDGIIDGFMKTEDWSAGGHGNIYEFTLFDMSQAQETQTKEKTPNPTGWDIEPKALLTIYVDRATGDTFIRRHIRGEDRANFGGG